MSKNSYEKKYLKYKIKYLDMSFIKQNRNIHVGGGLDQALIIQILNIFSKIYREGGQNQGNARIAGY